MSFARTVKDELCELPVKSDCCKAALLYGLLQFSAVCDDGTVVFTTENENVVSLYERLLVETVSGECEIGYFAQGFKLTISDRETLFSIYSKFGDLQSFEKGIMKCEHCLNHYFRGAFLCRGTVNGPGASFHLEIECPNLGAATLDLLAPLGISFKYSSRGDNGIIYLKDGGSIEYFLHFIDARAAAFAVSDEIIRREIRGNVNRQNNFDLANQQRTVNAGSKYIKAIEKLIAHNRLSSLPDDLRVTAELKLGNPDAPLSALASLHEPKISKSGLYHRLERLADAADEIG